MYLDTESIRLALSFLEDAEDAIVLQLPTSELFSYVLDYIEYFCTEEFSEGAQLHRFFDLIQTDVGTVYLEDATTGAAGREHQGHPHFFIGYLDDDRYNVQED